MSQLLGQLSNDLLPFRDSADVATGIISAVLALIAVVLGLVVLVSLLIQKNLAPRMTLLLSLCFADMVYSANIVVIRITDLAAGTSASSNVGGWATGRAGCLIDSVFVIVTCTMSILSLLSITVERCMWPWLTVDLMVVWKVPTGDVAVRYWSLMIWLVSLLFALFPVITNSHLEVFALHPGRLYCVVAWGRSQWVTIMNVFAMITIGSALCGLTFCYTRIVQVFMDAQRKHRQNKGSKSVLAMNEKEKKIALMSFIITFNFCACYSPYFLLILYEWITGNPIAPALDQTCTVMVILNSVANPILLLKFDASIRTNVLEMLGIRGTSSPMTSTNISTGTRPSLGPAAPRPNRTHSITPDTPVQTDRDTQLIP
ncbi:hypothetical protein HDU91_000146 [Kappamyces sp. JEL0680]|nr:hypothetical protein HDU91_000146 [Kappamyces sp. JEL0680]